MTALGQSRHIEHASATSALALKADIWLQRRSCEKAQMSNVILAEVVSFWREAGPERWFSQDEDFDLTITARFLATHEAAARGELATLEENPEGALALVILLDQFPRNMFRGNARAFATDPLARAVADRALVRGFDQATDEMIRPFFYLPFMHSELLADQDRSVRLHEAFGDTERLRYAVIHRDIVVKFGRFPHRNRAVGRRTTPAEQEFFGQWTVRGVALADSVSLKFRANTGIGRKIHERARGTLGQAENAALGICRGYSFLRRVTRPIDDADH
jgi:uncharacterized protein (DUF924 family)